MRYIKKNNLWVTEKCRSTKLETTRNVNQVKANPLQT